jgi:hypothetical protein
MAPAPLKMVASAFHGYDAERNGSRAGLAVKNSKKDQISTFML